MLPVLPQMDVCVAGDSGCRRDPASMSSAPVLRRHRGFNEVPREPAHWLRAASSSRARGSWFGTAGSSSRGHGRHGSGRPAVGISSLAVLPSALRASSEQAITVSTSAEEDERRRQIWLGKRPVDDVFAASNARGGVGLSRMQPSFFWSKFFQSCAGCGFF